MNIKKLKENAPLTTEHLYLSPMRMLYELCYLSIIKKESKGRVLELGAGTGVYRKLFQKKDYVGIDIDTYHFPEFDGYVFKKMNAMNLSFGSKKFDCVFALSLLEHVHSSKAVIDEAFRVLKPKGKFIIAVPTRIGLIYEGKQPTYDYYSKKKLCKILESSGFKIEKAITQMGLFTHAYIALRTMLRFLGMPIPKIEHWLMERAFIADFWLGEHNLFKINTFVIAQKDRLI
jgi:SAM-dependent methyltransferase